MSTHPSVKDRRIPFGPFAFELTTGELTRNGHIVPLRPKAAEILSALVESKGRLVTREALVERAWPDTILEADTALHTAIRQIRRALGDSATNPSYIETVHRRGYRFIGGVHATTPRSKLSKLPVGVALLALPVAIVLIANAGLFGRDGDDTTNATTVTQAAYFVSRGTPEDLRRATELLEPSAPGSRSSRAWSTLATAYSLSGRYENAKHSAQRALKLDNRSADAHRVLAESAMMGLGDWSTAEKEFLQALELDPNDATAHSGYSFLLLLTGRPVESVREIRRAAALEPLSTLINGDAAYVFYWAGQFDDAVRQALKTLEIEPGYPSALECLRLARLALGQIEEGREAAIRFLRSGKEEDS